MQLSVIILNYNVRYFLELCLISVQKALKDIDGEIIVVDNNSSDDSEAIMEQRFSNLKFIKNEENFGFPKGNNIGVANAKGEYICILNPDTVVAEDTFKKILAFAKKQKDIGIVGCKLIDGTGNFLPECKRGIPTPFVSFTKIFGLYKLSNVFGKYYAQEVGENETGKVDILVGAFMFMKRNLYIEIDGFDEKCFMYSDDIDLSYRALQKRKVNYYFHETSILHYKGESTIRDKIYMKRFKDSMNFFYKKHFKISFFFSLFMNIGILFFSLFKMLQGNAKPKNKITKYILISENEDLRQKLEKQLFMSVEKQQLSQFFSFKKGFEIIFDNNYVDFKTIIQIMERYRHLGVTFKIIPESAHFMIGSNSSFDRGEVITISY